MNATSHPLGGLGGHSMPTAGTIGGAKGVGGAATAAAASAAAVKVRGCRVITSGAAPVTHLSPDCTKSIIADVNKHRPKFNPEY